jgi:mono/diheme cytochrome c family protein
MRPSLLALALLSIGSGCKADPPKEQRPAGALSPSAPAALVSAANPAAPRKLTPEEAKTAQGVIVNDCLACHVEELLVQQRLTATQWAAVVKKMQGWGSLVEPSNAELLGAFLSARYGVDAPPYDVPTVSASAAAEALAPLPDGPFAGGETTKGEALYKEACASCHGADARGTATGTKLADRPLLYRAAEFAEAIKRGRGRMPAFPLYKDPEIGALLAYLRGR